MSPKLFNILLILTPVALYLGYIDPFYNGVPGLIWTPEKNLNILKLENVQHINAISQLDLIKSESEQLLKNYKAIDPKVIEKVNNLLPDSIDPVKLRNDITSIAAESGLALTGLSVVSEVDSYKVSFSVRSKYLPFKSFMERYEKSTRMFVLENLSIGRPDESKQNQTNEVKEDPEILTVKVVSRVYFKKITAQ